MESLKILFRSYATYLPHCQGAVDTPRERQLRAGRGGGVLHGLRHTGGTADLGGDAAGTAYDGGKGKYLSNWRKALVDNLMFYSHIKDNGAWT